MRHHLSAHYKTMEVPAALDCWSDKRRPLKTGFEFFYICSGEAGHVINLLIKKSVLQLITDKEKCLS